MRVVIVQMLRREGFDVLEARDGVELVEQVARIQRDDGSGPELLLTDVRMPRRSGIDALRLLRGALPGTAILVITAFSDEALRVAAGEAGADALLDKPFELDDLRSAVASLVR
jgi:DNA-binding response OmpR family regulator